MGQQFRRIRPKRIVIDNPERVEDPNVTALSAAEAVFQGPFAAFYETWTFVENSPGVWMEVVGPTLGIGCHLLRRIAHDRLEILAGHRCRQNHRKPWSCR